MAVTRDQVMDALRKVQDPELFRDIVTLNMVKEVRLDGDAVFLTVELTTPACPMKETIERDIRSAMASVGVSDVTLNLTAQTRGSARAKESPLPQVKNVIAVGAGKGGVGKSTLAVNIAVALQRAGANVGLMDGDIYGPSLPTLLGIQGEVPSVVETASGRKIRPLLVHGIHAITIGSLVEPEKPARHRRCAAHALSDCSGDRFGDCRDTPAGGARRRDQSSADVPSVGRADPWRGGEYVRIHRARRL
jgi:ATP-binding protein involved in chromosome partitioning